ncbi:DUF4412 domain-containing protein [Bacteroidota bacterium]
MKKTNLFFMIVFLLFSFTNLIAQNLLYYETETTVRGLSENPVKPVRTKTYFSNTAMRIEKDNEVIILKYYDDEFIKTDLKKGLFKKENAGSLFGKGDRALKKKVSNFKLEETDESAEIAGYDCDKYIVRGKGMETEVWITDEIDLYEEIRENTIEAFKNSKLNPKYTNILGLDMEWIEGFPMKTITRIGFVEYEQTIVNVAEKKFDPSLFRPQPDHTEITPYLNLCQFAEQFMIQESDFALDYQFNMTYELENIDINFNTAPGDCALNSNEAGEGYRVEGTIKFNNDIELTSNDVNWSFVNGNNDAPYFLKIDISLDDITFESQGDMDISAYCASLDADISGSVEDISIVIKLEPPHGGHNHFSIYGSPTISFDTDVNYSFTSSVRSALEVALAWLLPPCNVSPFPFNIACAEDAVGGIESMIEQEVNEQMGDYVDSYIESMVGSLMNDPTITGAVDAVDTWFWFLVILKTGTLSSISQVDDINICSSQYENSIKTASYEIVLED